MSKEEIEILFNKGKIFCQAGKIGTGKNAETLQEVIKSAQFSRESLEVEIKISIRKDNTLMEQIETHRSVKRELLESEAGNERLRDETQEKKTTKKRRKEKEKKSQVYCNTNFILRTQDLYKKHLIVI